MLAALSGGLLAGAALAGAWTAAAALALSTVFLLGRPLRDCAAAMAAVVEELAPAAARAPAGTRPLPEFDD